MMLPQGYFHWVMCHTEDMCCNEGRMIAPYDLVTLVHYDFTNDLTSDSHEQRHVACYTIMA